MDSKVPRFQDSKVHRFTGDHPPRQMQFSTATWVVTSLAPRNRHPALSSKCVSDTLETVARVVLYKETTR